MAGGHREKGETGEPLHIHLSLLPYDSMSAGTVYPSSGSEYQSLLAVIPKIRVASVALTLTDFVCIPKVFIL